MFSHLQAPSSLRSPCKPLVKSRVWPDRCCSLLFLSCYCSAECSPQTRAVPATFLVPCPWVCAVPLDREVCHTKTG